VLASYPDPAGLDAFLRRQKIDIGLAVAHHIFRCQSLEQKAQAFLLFGQVIGFKDSMAFVTVLSTQLVSTQLMGDRQ